MNNKPCTLRQTKLMMEKLVVPTSMESRKNGYNNNNSAPEHDIGAFGPRWLCMRDTRWLPSQLTNVRGVGSLFRIRLRINWRSDDKDTMYTGLCSNEMKCQIGHSANVIQRYWKEACICFKAQRYAALHRWEFGIQRLCCFCRSDQLPDHGHTPTVISALPIRGVTLSLTRICRYASLIKWICCRRRRIDRLWIRHMRTPSSDSSETRALHVRMQYRRHSGLITVADRPVSMYTIVIRNGYRQNRCYTPVEKQKSGETAETDGLAAVVRRRHDPNGSCIFLRITTECTFPRETRSV